MAPKISRHNVGIFCAEPLLQPDFYNPEAVIEYTLIALAHGP